MVLLSGFQHGFKFSIGGDPARDFELSVHEQGGCDHDPEIGETEKVRNFFDFIFKTEFIRSSDGCGGESFAFGAAGAQDLEFHVFDMLE